jgi:hypothetical protein
MGQRCEFFAGNFLDNQSVTIALTSQTRNRYSAHRKRDLHGISKAKRRVESNFRLRSIRHRRFAALEGQRLYSCGMAIIAKTCF